MRLHSTLKVMDEGTLEPVAGKPDDLHRHFLFVFKKIAQVAAIYGVGASYDASAHTIYASGSPASLLRFSNELGFCKIAVLCVETKTM